MGYEKNHENGGNIQATTKTMTMNMKMTREEGNGRGGLEEVYFGGFRLLHATHVTNRQSDSQT